MAEIDDFRIKATIDASGATAGADQVAQDVNKIAEATGNAGEEAVGSAGSFDKFLEHAGGLRTGRMMAQELFETMQGGGETIQGVTGLMRVFALTSMEAFGPVGLAFVGISLALAGLIAKHDEHKEKLSEGKDAEDSFGAAAKQAALNAEDGMKVATAALKEYLDVQKQVIEGEDRRSSYAQQQIKDMEAQHEATTKLALAQLELEKQKQLAAAKSGSERDAVEAAFKAKEAAIKGAETDDKFALEKQAKEAEIKANNEKRQSLQDENSDNDSQLKQLQDDAAATAAQAAQDGVTPQRNGSFERALKQQEKTTDEAEKAYRDEQKRPGASSAAVTSAQDSFIFEQKKLADLQDAQDAHEALITDGKELKKAIEQSSQEVGKLLDANDHLARQLAILPISQQAAKTEEQASHIGQQKEASDKKADDELKDREAKRKAQLDDINAQLKGTSDPTQKVDLDKQRAALEAAGIRDKADTEKKEGKLTAAEYNEARARAGDTVTGAEGQAAVKANKAAQKADKKEDIEQINQAKSSIEGTGNKELIAAMHQIVKMVLDKHAELAALQALLAQGTAAKFQQVDNEMQKTRGAISSMRNNHQS